ncbi:response regulator [Rhizobium sp. LEGMi198b]|uniref:response regulator n=1 Tax=unclassified Rhizobium TaxID=2613769 RepID=UPI0021A72801|nr:MULTISPECIES: response regulator [Rhizobium]MDK4742666.1 response regulator [Rhizobium sp. CNPSo 3464]UWU23455.1 response regulator [Rhizobium tropici]WFU06042.1 response regulator [Rhizobium sp. CB3171]
MSQRYSHLFSGRRILIVEDEYLLANEARRQLLKLGAIVIGPTARVDQALELIQDEDVDAAILDVHLDGEMVFPVAERLDELKIPYVFATGYDPSIIPARFTGFVLCEKPIEIEHIARGLFGPRQQDT